VKILVLVGFRLEVLRQQKVVEQERALKEYGLILKMMNDFYFNSFEKTEERWQKIKQKDLLSTNLATKKGYCTQRLGYVLVFALKKPYYFNETLLGKN
jgi:hypothetical protein